MEQTNAEKGKKLGADGLTKKERRALNVSATGNNSNTKNTPIKNEDLTNCRTAEVLPVKTDSIPRQSSVNNRRTGNQFLAKELKEESKVVSKPPADKVNVNQINNKELKAQRKAVHEAQRLAKANEKNIEQHQIPLKKGKSKEAAEEENKQDGGEPSKAELRAQRRAIQEAQRSAKSNVKTEQAVNKQPNEKIGEKSVVKQPSPKREIVKSIKSVNKHKVPLFNHLYFENTEITNLRSGTINISGVHASFLKIGGQYTSKTILGSNARCLALLSALKSLISDFTTPPKQEFCRSLESALQTCVLYLNNCRPLAVSMTNALRHFKLHLTQINTNLSDNEKRAKLLECVEIYIQDEIAKAGEAISIQVRGKISNSDVILIYGCSSLVIKILLDAHREGKKFKVIVVDARPLLEGKEMLRKLVCAGIHCSYVLINAASFVMSRVTKVLLGAHALLANGYVMSRTGTAQVALIANSYKKPVLVCCETYKFCERVQTDSFVYNEIGDPDKLVSIDTAEESSPLTNWRNSNYLTPLNLMYDVTPPDLVTAVVTELAFLPCTSVPVILRIRPTEIIT